MRDETDTLAASAAEVFTEVRRLSATQSVCRPVAEPADRWVRTFAEPMRVAVAGEIKRGKSTLVNALVGAEGALSVTDADADLAMATGQLETTYVLTELVYGTPPGIVVHYRDQTFVTCDLADLRGYTVRRASEDEKLKQVERVVVTLDAPLLHRLCLVDTPGFNSVYGTDGQNALAFLTAKEVAAADAVLYTIDNKGLSRLSQDVATRFVGTGATLSPMKAIGVMPRSNEHWSTRLKEQAADPDADTDPFAVAHREIATIWSGAGRSLFHAIVPVAGLLGEAAATAPDADLSDVAAFHDLDPRLLQESFRKSAPDQRFGARPDFPLTPVRRQELVTRFSPWGLWTAIQESRTYTEVAQLRQVLDERSGVAGLRDLVRNHFGARADAIRLQSALNEVLAANRRLRLRLPAGGPEHRTTVEVGGALERLELAHRSLFDQIDVLGLVYAGRLRLSPPQQDDLLRLTGEHGLSLPARLGLPDRARHTEIRAAAVAAHARWSGYHAQARNPAIAKMVSSCDALLHEIDTLQHSP